MRDAVRRIGTIISKEFVHILRDGRTLFLVFVSPAFMLLMLSYLFTWDVDTFGLAVFDQDRSSVSRQYIDGLTQHGNIELRYRPLTREQLDELLVTGRVHAALVVPPGLTERFYRGETGSLQVIVDGTSPATVIQMLYQLAGRTQALLATPSTAVEEAGDQLAAIDIRTRVWYNPTLKALHSMVPGLIAVVMCMPAFSIAASVVREKEIGTLEGLLATPIRGAELLLGKLAAYMAGGLVSVVPVFLVATLWFQVPFRGNFLIFLVLTADFLLGVLGVGLLLAGFVSSQQAAIVVLFLVLFTPSMFLSGLIDPVDKTSLVAQLQAYTLPTTHYITVSRAVFLKGAGWNALVFPSLSLAAMGTGSLLLAVKLFSKKLG